MTNKHAIHRQFTTHNLQFTKYAFTLAETLIVMGIIGVVAALTLPNLNSSTGDQEKVVKLQKIYSNLNDAFGRAEAVYGPISGWCSGISDNSDCSKKYVDRFSDFLKVSKTCNDDYGCLYSDDDYPPYMRGVILADGASVAIGTTSTQFSQASSSVTYDAPEKYCFGDIFVDIDGPNKGKRSNGYDIFRFFVTTKGIVPSGGENAIDQFNPNGGADYLATDWVIKFGNMDYLKVKSGKCPDGKTVLNWTTNTTCK